MNVKFPMLLFALVVAAGCAEPPVATVTGIPTTDAPARVERGEFRDVIHLTGEVESAGGETIVVPRIPNWQTTVRTLVRDGTQASPGNVIAELDSTQFSSGLEQRRQGITDAVQSIAQQLARNEAELKQKEFDFEQKRVALEKARMNARIPKEILPLRNWEENQLALKRAGSEFEKARNDLESEKKAGEAEVANLRLTKVGAERDIRNAEDAIEALTLRAGSAGVVVIGENGMTGRKLQMGDTVCRMADRRHDRITPALDRRIDRRRTRVRHLPGRPRRGAEPHRSPPLRVVGGGLLFPIDDHCHPFAAGVEPGGEMRVAFLLDEVPGDDALLEKLEVGPACALGIHGQLCRRGDERRVHEDEKALLGAGVEARVVRRRVSLRDVEVNHLVHHSSSAFRARVIRRWIAVLGFSFS